MELVEGSWNKLGEITKEHPTPLSEFSEMFYNRLWEQYPSTRDLFKNTDMFQQGLKLTGIIGKIVGAIRKLGDDEVSAVKALGARHYFYHVKDSDYDAVAGALLWALETRLGEMWTEECKNAWVHVYTTLATIMKKATKDKKEKSKAKLELGDKLNDRRDRGNQCILL